jgi:crotonobetainyl-CoA:carnitine CoA-transferase CaiB-like acyl-CoA transferase
MLALAVGNDSQFAKCAVVLGHPGWATDERFILNRDRVAHRDLVDGMIAEALKTDAVDAWISKLQAAGVPCGKINSVKQAFDDPQTAARDMIVTAEHPTIGTVKMVGTPFKLSATPTSVRRAPPTLSQHAEEILKQELGMDDAQIARLRSEKVI